MQTNPNPYIHQIVRKVKGVKYFHINFKININTFYVSICVYYVSIYVIFQFFFFNKSAKMSTILCFSVNMGCCVYINEEKKWT